MRAVIFGYFGTLTDPGAEEYREPLAHRTGELLGGCRPRFREALAGSFGERTIGVHGGTESTLRAINGSVMPASASRGTTRSASWRNSGGGGSGSAC